MTPSGPSSQFVGMVQFRTVLFTKVDGITHGTLVDKTPIVVRWNSFYLENSVVPGLRCIGVSLQKQPEMTTFI